MTGDAARSPQTILVADDDPDLLLLINVRLTNAGYTVISACDGRQALTRIVEQLPDMALLDVMMPEMTGTEVLMRLREVEATRDLPVILTSAGFYGDLSDFRDAARADDYISKPFGRGVLESRVAALFARTVSLAADAG